MPTALPGRVLGERVDEADHDKLDAEDVDPDYGEEGGQAERTGQAAQAGHQQEQERDDATDDPFAPEGPRPGATGQHEVEGGAVGGHVAPQHSDVIAADEEQVDDAGRR